MKAIKAQNVRRKWRELETDRPFVHSMNCPWIKAIAEGEHHPGCNGRFV